MHPNFNASRETIYNGDKFSTEETDNEWGVHSPKQGKTS